MKHYSSVLHDALSYALSKKKHYFIGTTLFSSILMPSAMSINFAVLDILEFVSIVMFLRVGPFLHFVNIDHSS